MNHDNPYFAGLIVSILSLILMYNAIEWLRPYGLVDVVVAVMIGVLYFVIPVLAFASLTRFIGNEVARSRSKQ